ncbi:MAG TPA: DUF262 domain-containing HNH endonuclease family protein [Caulobacterales bacterium]|nr:DUF262 domain-containing HNH endonuclease family protein [Caulobacterales bacterium]
MLGAQILTVAQLFALGRFAPASVQRDYQWEERQCQELFSDFERVFAAGETARDEPDSAMIEDQDDGPALVDTETPAPSSQREYVLNAMVMRPLENGHYEVFDGLQRLTTLTVLVSVLRDLCAEAALASQLDHLIVAADGAFRVVLPGKDATLREEVQKRGEAGRARRSQPSSDMGARVRAACALFRRELSRWDAQRRHAFADFLMNRVQLIAIFADDPLVSSQIFVTTNARGLPLDKVGLFKGQLMDIAQDEATAERIAQVWVAVQTLVGDDLEDLLTALDFIERREPQGAERLTKLADHLAKRYGGAEIGQWVARLELYAGAWRDLHRRLFDPADSDLGASMWMLRLLKWREWKPLALIWTAQYLQQSANSGQADRARALFARRFDALHRRCMAITLTGNSDLDRAKIFARAIGQAAQRRDPLDRQGALGFDANAQARIQETLRLPLIHDDTRLSLLRWIEALLWPERPPRAIARTSVEHVLPLRPHANSQWLKQFPNEEARFNICHALGNLAVIEYKANEGMGNADFAAKLPVLREQAQKFKLMGDVATHDAWTAEIIGARTKKLCDFVWRELQLPPPRTPKAQG